MTLGPDASAAEIVSAVTSMGDAEKAASARRFFKTGPGEYGEGDEFVGVRVPDLRKISRTLRGLPAPVIVDLLASGIHEVRHLALFTMTHNFTARGSDREAWVQVYRDAVRAGRVNNWDLVDCSAADILGAWLVAAEDHGELLDWAASDDLWRRRVGIIGTYAFIRARRPDALSDVAPLVIGDRRDLVQKAFGWMLRETGKRIDVELLTRYLDVHAPEMGRTALSYAVEKFSPEDRAHYRSLK
ncbi:DNA alkylation repair protein [Gordonia malaquae]|uniref:DNA alkylation repair protein n=1 Tax=Gordonia malaquae TaxID=410332 RepID=UPI0030FEA0AF